MTIYTVDVSETLTVSEGDVGVIPELNDVISTDGLGIGLEEEFFAQLPAITETLIVIESIPSPIIADLSETLTVVETIVQSIYNGDFEDFLVVGETFLVDSSSTFSNPATFTPAVSASVTFSFAGSEAIRAQTQTLTVIEGFTGYSWRNGFVYPRSLEDVYVG